MVRFLLFSAIIIGAVSFIVYHLARFLLSINVGKNRLTEESDKLRQMLNQDQSSLIPFTWNDFLSLSAVPEIEKNVFTQSDNFMILQSVYSEPLFKVARKTIIGSDKEVVMVKSSQDEILFHDYGKDIQVFYNEEYIGFINQIGNFVDPNMNIRANMHLHDNNEYRPLEIDKTITGVMANPNQPNSISTRNYKPIVENLDEADTKIATVMILANQLFG